MGLPFGADGEFVAATCAAAGDHSTAIGGLHPGQKSVGLGAAPIVRLKSTFRHFRLTLSVYYRQGRCRAVLRRHVNRLW